MRHNTGPISLQELPLYIQYFAITTKFWPIYKNMRLVKRLKKVLRRFIRECCGPTATEYAVLLVLIVFGALAAISLLGSFVSSSTQSTAEALPSGVAGDGASGGGSGGSKPPKRKAPRRRGRRGRASISNPRKTSPAQRYALITPTNPHIQAHLPRRA